MKKEIEEKILNRKELLSLIFSKKSKIKPKHNILLTKEVLDIALEQARQQERERIIEKIRARKKVLKELIGKFNLDIDKNRIDELEQIESIINQ